MIQQTSVIRMYGTYISDTYEDSRSHYSQQQQKQRVVRKSGKMNAVCNKVQQLSSDIMNVGNYVVHEWHNKMSIKK